MILTVQLALPCFTTLMVKNVISLLLTDWR